jgi:hypothetical protein
LGDRQLHALHTINLLGRGPESDFIRRRIHGCIGINQATFTEQPAGMVPMQMGHENIRDLIGRDAKGFQRARQMAERIPAPNPVTSINQTKPITMTQQKGIH